MRFFRRHRPQAPPDHPGWAFLEDAVREGWDSLGTGRLEDLYRASLRGGLAGARGLLSEPNEILTAWGDGSADAARRLISVWGSTVALILLQHQQDQRAVCDGVARGFALLYDADYQTLLTELDVYQQQREAETREESYARRGFSFHLLLIRTMTALGAEAIDFNAAEPPFTGMDDLFARVPVDETALVLSVRTFMLAQDARLEALSVGRSAFDQMARTSER